MFTAIVEDPFAWVQPFDDDYKFDDDDDGGDDAAAVRFTS